MKIGSAIAGAFSSPRRCEERSNLQTVQIMEHKVFFEYFAEWYFSKADAFIS